MLALSLQEPCLILWGLVDGRKVKSSVRGRDAKSTLSGFRDGRDVTRRVAYYTRALHVAESYRDSHVILSQPLANAKRRTVRTVLYLKGDSLLEFTIIDISMQYCTSEH